MIPDKVCCECGATIVAPQSNRQKYCKECAYTKILESNRKSYKKNLEKSRQRNRDRSADKRREYNQRTYWKNPDKYREKASEYYRNHTVEETVRRHKRRSKAGGWFTADDWLKICEDANYCCIDCGKRTKLTVGHAIPISRGGTNHPDNIIPQCLPCNLRQHSNIHPSKEYK